MTLSRVGSRAGYGLSAAPVSIETHISNGLPSFTIVGLSQSTVRECRERVRSALLNSGFAFPAGRITVNLAPSELPKNGGRYDLGIALGILAATGEVPESAFQGREFYGELALSGALRSVPALFPAVRGGQKKRLELILPEGAANQLGELEAEGLRFAGSLKDVVEHLLAKQCLPSKPHESHSCKAGASSNDLSDLSRVRGQASARRALEIAAAGHHHLLMYGSPGCGKSLLAHCLPSVLPPLSQEQAVDVAALYSVHGQPRARLSWRRPPIRSPHHKLSSAALLGGGAFPRPGELSLAHHGVLFLDELCEFRQDVLESLRQPLESGEVRLSRVLGQQCFPARAQVVAALNPCPCGYWGDASGRCRCSTSQRQRYLGRLSGPLLDRFDLRVGMQAIKPGELMGDEVPESSDAVAQRVARARRLQWERQGCLNATLSGEALKHYADPGTGGRLILEKAAARLNLSARALDRSLRVARSIADLANVRDLAGAHILEALSFRNSPETLDKGAA